MLHFMNKLLSTTQFSDTNTKAVYKETMLSGVKFLLDFFRVYASLYSTVGIFMSGHEWLKSSCKPEKLLRKLNGKKYLRLGFLFRKSTINAGQICPPYLAVTTENWKIRRQCLTWPTYFVHTA